MMWADVVAETGCESVFNITSKHPRCGLCDFRLLIGSELVNSVVGINRANGQVVTPLCGAKGWEWGALSGCNT